MWFIKHEDLQRMQPTAKAEKFFSEVTHQSRAMSYRECLNRRKKIFVGMTGFIIIGSIWTGKGMKD